MNEQKTDITIMLNQRITKSILYNLNWLRAAALLIQLLYLFWLEQSPLAAVWVVLTFQLIVVVNQFMVKKNASPQLLFINLIIDASLLTLYVYATGGAVNPLISLLFLPVVTSAAILNQIQSFIILLLANILYSLIWWSGNAEHQGHSFNEHILGMWLVFIGTSVLMFFVVGSLSRITQQQYSALERNKHKQVRDDHIMALGLAAADAAHQLNTPLSSLSVLLEDLSEANGHNADEETLVLMQQQVARCNLITQQMSKQYQQFKTQDFVAISLTEFVATALNKYRLIDPAVNIKVEKYQVELWESAYINSHIGLYSALLNIFDNAAKASNAAGESKKDMTFRVEVSIDLKKQICFLTITDFGNGLDSDFLAQYGISPYEHSQQGMGVGSLVSSASIERAGGELSIENNAEGGAKVIIKLPIHFVQEAV
ncbi:MAG: sensor histidine kinase [Kangiellaceae bacterium]|nr:sensor histidine kinase [Kangiellaceae bacterium]